MVSAPDERSTKVYYYLDDSTPYVSVVPVPSDQICLGDFKEVFNRKDFKYFCKELDNDIGREVKTEITKDDTRLKKSSNGLFELFLLPANQSGTLPRRGNYQNGLEESAGYRLNKRRSMQALSSANGDIDMNGGQRVSMMTTDQSISAGGSMHTFISRRAGEHLADIYTSNSENPYTQEENSTFSIDASSFQDTSNNLSKLSRKRRPRKDRYRKPYVPSTISSASESSISYSLPRVEEVHLTMKEAPYLGISVVSHDGGIFVSSIKPGGAADRCGMIEVGDQIVQVNQTSFENLNDKEAIAVLKKVAKTKRSLTIYVAKRPRNSDQRSDALSALCETLPVDVSLWVDMTAQAPPPRPFETTIDEEDSVEPTGSVIDMTSDEERAAYMDRRNGIGAHFVPVLQTQKFEEAMRMKENEENEKLLEKLTIEMNPITILRHMARPDSGLTIKNRKWLKIPVPMSFIGDEMVDWLFEHVHGFRDRKAAKSYAAMLLEQGYIRHVVNKLTFTEKCYYVFEESIANERRRYEQAKAKAESNTEVTYVSEQSSPFLNQSVGIQGPQISIQQHPHPLTKPPLPSKPLKNIFGVSKSANKVNNNGVAMAPHNSTQQTWPISPIPIVGRVDFGGTRDCDSPMTNDYASMIQGEINGGYATTNASHPNGGTLPHVPDPYPSKPPRDPIDNRYLNGNHMNGAPSTSSYQQHSLLQAPQPKIRSVSPPPPNTPNTLSGSSICLIPPIPSRKPT